MNPTKSSFVTSARAQLGAAGFDVVEPFSAASVAQQVFPGAAPWPLFGRDDALGLLIGNSRALWEPLTAWAGARPELAHPLDVYTETTVREFVDACSTSVWLGWGHIGVPSFLPIQRIAVAAGVASLGPGHLVAHPRFGPWIALRAVLVLDARPPNRAVTEPALPCSACDAPCRAALDDALRAAPPRLAVERRSLLSPAQESYLRIRDVCPVGRDNRYSDDQILYHYAGNRRGFRSSSPEK